MIILAITILVLCVGGIIYVFITDESVLRLLIVVGLSVATLFAVLWALDYTINYFNLIK